MKKWKITGVVATVVIILSIPFYLLKHKYITPSSYGVQAKPAAIFVGTRKCKDCHQKEYDKWRDSHHDHAMEVADDNTVLGDFDNAVFENHGVTSRFYQKDGRFFVHTQGSNGKMDDFEVAVPSPCLGYQRKKVVSPLPKGTPFPK
ncbi:MAG: hypothetical protein JRE10_00010 [Deltaproteobacteria bacterium]|nr:hypothetical protein [Deltaproteobacteria bacterium]